MDGLQERIQAALERAVADPPGLAGAAAVVTGPRGLLAEGGAGARGPGPGGFDADTVCALYSCTKAVTLVACLQLAEDGRLDLDAPAAGYLPELGTVRVLEGFDGDGRPLLRAPHRPVTARLLLTHTSGFGYDFASPALVRLDLPPVASGRRAALAAPLLHDPGEGWTYGIGLDWAGLLVEAVAGRRLGEVMAERIFAPLGMADTGFALTPGMAGRRAAIHHRLPDGGLKPSAAVLPQEAEVQMGGHGLYSSPRDYARFLRLWLDGGAGVLRPDTVAMALRGGVGIPAAGCWRTALPRLSLDHDPLPGVARSWALAGVVAEAPVPGGRPRGAVGWGGLANLYWWVDPAGGLAGLWATQVLPFGDPAAVAGARAFETAVYGG